MTLLSKQPFTPFCLWVFLILTLVFLTSCTVETDDNSTHKLLNLQAFAIVQDASFYNVYQTLQYLADRQATTSRNDFCVIGYQHVSKKRDAYVYWKQQNKLILWEPEIDTPRQDLLKSRRYLDLKKDVIMRPKSLWGKTFSVNQAWVDALIYDCNDRGDQFVITVNLKKKSFSKS